MSNHKQQNHAVPGYIYLIYDPAVQLYKIGLSRTPATRLRYLKQSYGTQLKLLQVAWTFDMLFVEQSLHKQFKLTKTYRGKIDGGTERLAFNWWTLPYVKVSLTSKCMGINLGYVLGAITLIVLVSLLLSVFVS